MIAIETALTDGNQKRQQMNQIPTFKCLKAAKRVMCQCWFLHRWCDQGCIPLPRKTFYLYLYFVEFVMVFCIVI